ncbi:hypothetical protein AVEN_247645-1 [Araneus ventricosus]|uniref:Uncharacterized protein n=1 Tax=Araneus ventricosus TaxID=182803 RepID=A0A4Y2RUM0_ARAVE|nr:hypothetical protein AVEN_165960-1 [Araneus ventricosus]GBN78959.1 hypothetical protein AVEN_247645-1 [Araneus ventricosus]
MSYIRNLRLQNIRIYGSTKQHMAFYDIIQLSRITYNNLRAVVAILHRAPPHDPVPDAIIATEPFGWTWYNYTSVLHLQNAVGNLTYDKLI